MKTMQMRVVDMKTDGAVPVEVTVEAGSRGRGRPCGPA